LDGLSFTAMRERYLEAYDTIRIDCLNGDKYKTGKTTPDGLPDPSIFSTEHNREGIQVGTAIATLIRKEDHSALAAVQFRHLWGARKRQHLLETAESNPSTLYEAIVPALQLGLPFVTTLVGDGYLDWISLPHLFPTSFPGVKTSRDEFLIDIDRDKLKQRIIEYFDPQFTSDDVRARYPQVMTASDRFDPVTTRAKLLRRGAKTENIVRYAYRPFDVRWLYWEPETKLLDEKRTEYWTHLVKGNLFIEAREKEPKDDFNRGTIVSVLADNFGNGLSTFFPRALNEGDGSGLRFNLTKQLVDYVTKMNLKSDVIFSHVFRFFMLPYIARKTLALFAWIGRAYRFREAFV
jgi:hypothetical protein